METKYRDWNMRKVWIRRMFAKLIMGGSDGVWEWPAEGPGIKESLRVEKAAVKRRVARLKLREEKRQ